MTASQITTAPAFAVVPTPRSRQDTEARERLYQTYSSTHAGSTSQGSAGLVFQHDIAPHLPTDRDVAILDAGCGQGALVAELTRAGYRRVRGVDISPEQVAEAHRAGISTVERGDLMTALTDAVGTLDVVIATDLLEHLNRDELLTALDAVARCLRPGGLMLARTPNGVSPFAGNYQFGDLTHETCLTPRSARQVLRVTGFTDISIRPCEPIVHGAASAVRWLVWKAFSGTYKLALAAETGSPRHHVVTQNMLIVARTTSRA